MTKLRQSDQPFRTHCIFCCCKIWRIWFCWANIWRLFELFVLVRVVVRPGWMFWMFWTFWPFWMFCRFWTKVGIFCNDPTVIFWPLLKKVLPFWKFWTFWIFFNVCRLWTLCRCWNPLLLFCKFWTFWKFGLGTVPEGCKLTGLPDKQEFVSKLSPIIWWLFDRFPLFWARITFPLPMFIGFVFNPGAEWGRSWFARTVSWPFFGMNCTFGNKLEVVTMGWSWRGECCMGEWPVTLVMLVIIADCDVEKTGSKRFEKW